ncbi:MAG: SulP family inorganic anion transporter [Planctomycetaceae bacterium]
MSAVATTALNPPLEKPQNGIAGLKHLRHDILSGIVVSLVSLPLSSGIAIASGVPPVYGLISAIIAGLLFPLLGGAYVTISGPAAGLAPALLAIMAAMGGAGDAEHVGEGYHFLLVIIFMVGCVQAVMALLKLARYCAIIPVSVVEGMLASIGLLIMVKQLPMFFGYLPKPHAHEFIEFVGEASTFAHGMTVPAFAVSFATLALLFWLGTMKHVKLLKIIPPQLIAVVAGVLLGIVFHLKDLGPGYLISLPEHPFHGIHAPAFSELFARKDLWYAAILGVITLTMIDGVESLATAMAIDRIDPFHRKSQPNRVLFAMAVSNIASSLIGGLTIIPGGVKSKANIASGGRTLWANFTNSICLVIYLVFARDMINLIPKGVLAAVLIYTGWKMCEPLIWNHIAHIGKEQLAIFTFTIVCTLATDLLWGIVAGVGAKFLLNAYLYRRSINESGLPDELKPTFLRGLLDFFTNPVTRREMVGDAYHLYVNKPLVCFNSMHVSAEVDKVPAEARAVHIHLDPGVALIDHTSCDNLLSVVQEFSHNNVPVDLDGLDDMRSLSDHHASTRLLGRAPELVTIPAVG